MDEIGRRMWIQEDDAESTMMMTKLKHPIPLAALLQVPAPKDTSAPDGVPSTNSVPPSTVSL
jgi:hypothetical protein